MTEGFILIESRNCRHRMVMALGLILMAAGKAANAQMHSGIGRTAPLRSQVNVAMGQMVAAEANINGAGGMMSGRSGLSTH